MQNFLTTFGKIIVTAGLAIGSLFGYHGASFAPSQNVGSVVPTPYAVFETYLANQQGTGDTTMTLANGTDNSGNILTGYLCFTVDQGTPTQEFECGTASSTTISGIQRGINTLGGTSTVSSNIYAHRRGADVKITDWPILGIITSKVTGQDGFDNGLYYNTPPNFSSATTTTLADTAYVNSVVAQGAATATNVVYGITRLSVAAVNANLPIAVGQNDPVLTTKSGSSTSATNPIIDNKWLISNTASTTPTASDYVQYQTNGELTASTSPATSTDAISLNYLAATTTISTGFGATPSASGVVAYPHGLGRIPRLLTIEWIGQGGNAGVCQAESYGTYNGSTMQGIFTIPGGSGSCSYSPSTSSAQVINNGAAGATSSFDATNFYLNWSGSSAGTSPRTFIWTAQ